MRTLLHKALLERTWIVSTRSLSYFITTPIFYVNSSPHIGHLYTLLAADALSIYQRLKNKSSHNIFSTGTDEHGIKIQTAASTCDANYKVFCDTNSSKFRNLVQHYGIGVTDFIRTTDENHIKAVQSVWTELETKGFIYKSTYSGWYCNSDEVFVPESQVSTKVIDGIESKVDLNDNLVKWTSEENYMFRLSEVLDQVHAWLSRVKPILPDRFNQEAISTLNESPREDLSISRPKSRLDWGIEVPGDTSQTVYVWLDALTNYLTAAGYPCSYDKLRSWPIDCQILGKDIIKFHAIYWPAFLLALDLPLPKRLLCHSHWMLDSLKMSKSKGNVVDPSEEDRILTKEGLRYYLLRCGTFHSDTDYSRIQAYRRVNAELADTYGNLLSRCCGIKINPSQNIPTKLLEKVDESHWDLLDRLDKLGETCASQYEIGNFYLGVDEIMSVLRLNNSLYEAAKPWKLINSIEGDHEAYNAYNNIQALTFETLRICSILLQPIAPTISAKALDRMNVIGRSWSEARVSVHVGDPKAEQRRVYSDKDFDPILFHRLIEHLKQ